METKTVCWQCGKRAPVNVSGVCEDCWSKYAYLREKGLKQRDDE